MFAVVPRVFHSPSSAPANVVGPIDCIKLFMNVIEEDVESSLVDIGFVDNCIFDGSGTYFAKKGDVNITPMQPKTVTTAFISKTGGGLSEDVIANAECRAGLLLANSTVMKPTVAMPRWYVCFALSFSSTENTCIVGIPVTSTAT